MRHGAPARIRHPRVALPSTSSDVPLEVEHAIARYAGVQDCAVYPVDDERWGQMVCAAVVGDVAVEQLSSWLRGELAAHKLPKQITVVGEIPRSATGKVQRSTLSGRLAADG